MCAAFGCVAACQRGPFLLAWWFSTERVILLQLVIAILMCVCSSLHTHEGSVHLALFQRKVQFVRQPMSCKLLPKMFLTTTGDS